MSAERDAAEALARIRASVGEVHRTYAFGAKEHAAAEAWRAIEQQCQAISVWRFCSRDKRRWHVIAMGEAAHADEVATAGRLCRDRGGRFEPGPPDPAMVPALRERRWQTTVAAGLRSGERVSQVIRYGRRGARLGRDGSIRPASRPQG